MRSFLLIVLSLLSFNSGPIKIMELPEGELAWTTERPKNAKMCVPAVFTDLEGNVEGEYRLNGVIHNPNKRLKVSICKDIFYVDRQWHSDSGFQQLVFGI